MTSEKLVARLRSLAARQANERGDMLHYGKSDAEVMEAADHIEALSARLKKMEGALEQLESKARLGGDALGNSPPEFESCRRAFYMLSDLARATLNEGGSDV